MNEHRWKKSIDIVYDRNKKKNKEWLDLKNVVSKKSYKTETMVYVSSEGDMKHAKRLINSNGMCKIKNIVPPENCQNSHLTALILKQAGYLDRILDFVKL